MNYRWWYRLLSLMLGTWSTVAAAGGTPSADVVPAVLSLRARAVSVTPAERVRIFWRYGGEGLGGGVTRGSGPGP